jgi:hypothetical protein
MLYPSERKQNAAPELIDEECDHRTDEDVAAQRAADDAVHIHQSAD